MGQRVGVQGAAGEWFEVIGRGVAEEVVGQSFPAGPVRPPSRTVGAVDVRLGGVVVLGVAAAAGVELTRLGPAARAAVAVE